MFSFIIILIVAAIVTFGLYKFLNRKKTTYSISEEELNQHLQVADIEKEKSVRKQWLISFFLVTAWAIGSTFLVMLTRDSPFVDFSENMKIFSSILISLIVAIVGVVPWSWITYHCAYKKRGSIWLLMIIISVPIGELFYMAARLYYKDLFVMDQGDWIMLAAYYVVETVYYVNCVRLYSVNCTRNTAKHLVIRERENLEISSVVE